MVTITSDQGFRAERGVKIFFFGNCVRNGLILDIEGESGVLVFIPKTTDLYLLENEVVFRDFV